MFSRFNHPQVRDLAWIASAPALLDSGTLPIRDPLQGSIWRRDPEQLCHTLQKLDDNPDTLAQCIPASHDRRLGNYYERLWHALLNLAPDIRLLMHNLKVWQQGRTLGELDVLLESAEGAVIHLELAIKFYLGRPSQLIDGSPFSPQSDWWGLDPRDRLDKKVNRLLTHQLPLAQYLQQVTPQLPHIDLSCAWLQGYLFHPREKPMARALDSHPVSQPSSWFSYTERDALLTLDGHWCLLPHKHWLMPPEPENAMSMTGQQLFDYLCAQPVADKQALMLSKVSSMSEQAPRLLCVGAQWPDL